MVKLIALAATIAVVAGVAAAQAPQAFDPKAFDADAGWYQLAPKLVAQVWSQDGRYFVRLTRRPTQEIVPTGLDAFSVKDVAAQITFERDASGKVTALVVHQNGAAPRGGRISEAAGKTVEAEANIPRTWPMLGASPLRFITDGSAEDSWPVFSPDGRKVLFSRLTPGQGYTLMTAPAAGGPAEAFLKPAPPLSTNRPNWSRSTGQVAFTAGEAQIWVAKADGTGAHVVASAGLSTQMVYPSWSPDGRSVVAMDGQNLVLKRVPMDGGAAETLTDRTKVFTGMPNVSPDGAWVAFAGQANTGQPYDQSQNLIWLVGPDAAARPLEAQPHQGRGPSWSPDGKRVAFESDRGSPDGRYAIFVINRDGSGLAQVTDYIGVAHPVFSPDGKRMVFDAQPGPGQRPKIAVVDLP